jgi:glycosyltransferase involved in cell wall biosynthesis
VSRQKKSVWLPALRHGTGVDVFTERLAAGLDRLGYPVRLQWLSPAFEFLPLLLHALAAPGDARVVICNLRVAAGLHRAGLPMIAIKHDCVGDPGAAAWETRRQRSYNRWLTMRWERLGLRLADRVVAISPVVSLTLAKGYACDSAQVIGNGIDSHWFVPPQLPRPARDRLRLLFVGKPSHRKGADLLLPILAAAGPQFELSFTGTQSSLPGWADAPAELRGRVRALGTLTMEAVREAYQAADILLFPTRSEGFGYATVEAMACGLPVVAGAAGATPLLIEHGVSGLLCPPGEVAAFAAALRLLADDPGLRARLGVAARDRVLAEFSLDRQIAAYAALIEAL